jgi:hypothetical protein
LRRKNDRRSLRPATRGGGGMKRVLRIVTVGLAFFVVDAVVEAPVHSALAQTSVKQVRAKKAKAQRQLPAAREPARQAAPAAQARTPAYDPASRDGGGY